MSRIKVIVEAGVNWHSIEEAKEFIRKSKELNLFATKFQCFTLEQCKEAKIPEYLVLTKDNIQELFNYSKTIKQEVFFTPMYPEIIEFLDKEVGVNYFKIRHKDRDNYDIYNRITQTNKPFFRSVGFLDYEIPRTHINEITMSCVPKYPATLQDYKWTYPYFLNNGLSDHTSSLVMLKQALKYYWLNDYYWERHMCLTKDCLESQWSSLFEQLKEVLKP